MKKLALAMIVRGTDEEALLLDRCLESLKGVPDAIYITVTNPPGEPRNHTVATIASKHGAHVSYFEWIKDFSAARNFNFSQVPKDFEYIMWSDADDIWRGADRLHDTLVKHPTVDAFGFWYLYDWDDAKTPTIVHKKTMIVRNDDSFYWEGALHEDLMSRRMISPSLVEGIDRMHLSSADRHEHNAKRNMEIAELEAIRKPDDPRSLWNLANSLYGVAKYEEARKVYLDFIEETEADEEKYLAHVRLSDVFRALGDENHAIKELQYAIGLEPMIPDAYLQLAHLYYNMGNMDKAEKYCLDGIQLKPIVSRMVVYNPRDYDYNPMMLLAQVYYHKGRYDRMVGLLEGCLQIYPKDERLKGLVEEANKEKERMNAAAAHIKELGKIKNKAKLKAAIEALPIEVRSHPAVAVLRNTNFIKAKSSGKDLVIYCGETTHTWSPETFEKEGIGGSEEAVIHLAREWAKLGWNVTVYNNCGHQEVTEQVLLTSVQGELQGKQTRVEAFTTVTYKPFWEWNYRDKQDVTILWRRCKPLDAEINSTKIYVDVHDVIPEGEFTAKRLERVSKIFVKTKFHRSLFPNIPDEKFAIVGNGLDIYRDPSIKRDPYLVINTSSPDRSLDVLPKLWKEVKKQVPKARMVWCYGWEIFRASSEADVKKLQWADQVQREMDEAGIETLGRLTQKQVGELYQKAHIFAYPTEFAEIDCISVKKAQAAGALAITTDFGALKETNVTGITVHSPKTKDDWNKPYQFHFGLEGEKEQQEWVEAVVRALKENTQPAKYDAMTWPLVAKVWDNEFTS